MIILIDNYDSFTYNLLHYLEENGENVEVIRNDEKSSEEILSKNPDAIVISPGPCDPDKAGVTLDLIKKCADKKIPVFGVCLGYQALAQVFGGNVIKGDVPVHGKTSEIIHEQQHVFKDVPSPFTATRYHSLIVEKDGLPSCLEITAETKDGVIMGLSHKELPLHGVQFHPESIASEYGHKILKNFISITSSK